MPARFIGDPTQLRPNGMTHIPVWVNGKQRDLELLLEWLMTNLCNCCCSGESGCVQNYPVTLRHTEDVLPAGDTNSKLYEEVREGWTYYIDGKIFIVDSATGNKAADNFSFVVTRAAGGAAAFDTAIISPKHSATSFVPGVYEAFGEHDDTTGDIEWTIELDGNNLVVNLNIAGGGYDVRAINSNIYFEVTALCTPTEGDAEGY